MHSMYCMLPTDLIIVCVCVCVCVYIYIQYIYIVKFVILWNILKSLMNCFLFEYVLKCTFCLWQS